MMKDDNIPHQKMNQKQSIPPKPIIWPYLIIFLVFIKVLAFAIQMVAYRQWLLTYVCQSEGSAPISDDRKFIWEQCTKDKLVHAKTARWDMASSLASNIPSILSIPIIGSLSDRIGRRPVFFLPLLLVFDFVESALLIIYAPISCRTGIIDLSTTLLINKFQASLWFMVSIKFTNGLFGSWGILFVVVQAYLADLVPPENRTTVFTHLEGAAISAFVIGPTLGGFLSRWFESGVVGVLQVSLVLRILCFTYLVIFIKESMDPLTIAETKRKLTMSGMVKKTVSSTFSIFYEKQSWNRVILLIVIFSTGIHLGSASCFFLWTAYKFKWDSYLHGIYQLTLSGSRLTWMLLLSLKFFSRYTRGEVWLLQSALFVMFFSYVVIGSIAESWVVFAMAAVHGLGILAKPTVQGLLSRSVAPDQQGSLFSGLQVTQQIGIFSASILFPNIWAVTVGTPFSSTFLFLEAGAMLLSCLLLFFLSVKELDRVRSGKSDEELTVPQFPHSTDANLDESKEMRETDTEVQKSAGLPLD